MVMSEISDYFHVRFDQILCGVGLKRTHTTVWKELGM